MTGVPGEVWLLALVSFLAGCGLGCCLACVFARLGVKAFADDEIARHDDAFHVVRLLKRSKV